LVLAFLLTGCVALVHQDERTTFDGEAATKVFAAGYTTIQDKYIEPVSSRKIAASGLAGLSTIDAAVSVRVTDDGVHLTLPDGVTADLTAPADDDAQKWATTTAAAISVARTHSKPLAAASSEDLYQAVFKASLAEFDRFSRYLPAKAARSARATRDGYGGIGIMLNFEAGRVTVDTVIPESPAARAGLKTGDMLLRIDRVETASMAESEVVDRLRGRVNSQVNLTLQRTGKDEPLAVALNRALIINPTVELEKRGNVAVIKLSGFNQGTTRNLAHALEQARTDMGDRLKGIVLDMRDNPGGLLDQAVGVSDLFLQSGRIVSTKGRHVHSVQVYDATGHSQFNLPMVVLVNGRSASAAEIVAAALQDDGRAVVVGSNSYGKGTVQNLSPLPNEGELVLTWSVYLAPSGYSLHNLGVLPNVCTSGFRGKPEEALDQLSPVWARLPMLMAAWRASSPGEGPKLDTMRENCPRSNDVRELEVDVARRLIENPALYRRALQATGSTVVAGPLQ
jgi:carboxyl-terminal processing protease